MIPNKGDYIRLVNDDGQPYFDYTKVEQATDKALFVGKKWIPLSQLTYNGTSYVKTRGMHVDEYILSIWIAEKLEWT